MKHTLPLIILVIFISACGSNKKTVKNYSNKPIDTTKRLTYNKILKSTDYDLKFRKAQEYYNREKYLKAVDLYEQMIPYYRGQTRGPKVYFMYCLCNYKTGDYLYAGYHFKSFYEMYPNSSYAERALFLSAYCYYLQSPRWSLDQEPTNEAINQFQLFLSRYSNKSLVDSSNMLVDELRLKLEKKSFRAAKLYYDLGYYQAAGIALNNILKDFPDTEYYEEVLFYIVKANIKYANGSIAKKQKIRYNHTIDNCNIYIEHFPSGNYHKEVLKIQEQAQKNLAKINQS